MGGWGGKSPPLQLCHSLMCPFMSCFAHHFGGRAHPDLDIRRVLCKNIISLPLADLILSKNQGGGKLAPWVSLLDLLLRAYMYLHGGGGPQVSEENQLRWGNPLVHILLLWSPHLSCKHDQIEMRDYMDRQVTPSKWVSSPPWGPSHLYVNRP